MYKYLPDFYAKSIFDIDYRKLKKLGIKGILVDIDNTLVPMDVKHVTSNAKAWYKRMRELGFKVCILTNANKKRTDVFRNEFGIEGIHRGMKPNKKNYLKCAAMLNLEVSQCVMLGDQLFTDVKGAKKVGMLSVLTHSLHKNEIMYVKLKRFRERRIIEKYGKKIKRL